MFKQAVSPFQRILALVALALVLPTVVLLVLELSFGLREQRQEIQAEALDRAIDVSYLVEGRLQADLSAMRVLATAQTAMARDWPRFATRARQVAGLNPGWKAVIVTDTAGGRQLVDTSQPDPTTPGPIQSRYLGDIENPVAVSGVFRAGGPCPCIALNTPLAAAGGHMVMTVLVDTGVFQDILSKHIADIPVAAVVDRDGNFIARVPGYAARVGAPGSVYLRSALRKGGDGVYRGTTLEGLANYTAYHTSALSGWSAHMAVAAGTVDQPVLWNNRLRIGGAILGLLVAAGLVAVALNELVMRRREEENLRQTQKLEALGRLTGGVAHDFNNVLTVIIGALDMLMARVDEPRAHRLAERALEAARRGARLTSQLLTFSRSQRLQVGSVDVARLIEDMDDLLHQSAGAAVRLSVNLKERPLFASTDANQIEFAILNLVLNARDAMPDGGDLTVEAGPGRSSDRILISVSDTGHGMERAVAERALEPFFSTKGPERGTGLGLAQVYGAVRQSGGDIAIDSRPGRGTTVRLILPRGAPGVTTPEGQPVDALRVRSGATVLVVDDEVDVRAVMAEAIASAGYAVEEAANGAAALDRLRSKHFDLLVTDFAMPGMNGADLALAARRLRPDQRILIVSGYADTQAIVSANLADALIVKPVDARSLCDAVAGALG